MGDREVHEKRARYAPPMPVDLSAASDPEALPYLTELSTPFEGEIRVEPEDFRVDEVPAYLPEGDGEHLFVRFRKRSLNTKDAVRRIAEKLGVDPQGCGWAGLKDRHAVTTQYASFHGGDATRLDGAEIEGVTILERALHRNKLRTGHLRGNRFEILVRGAASDRIDDARQILGDLGRRGLPNYFGPQRFGRNGDNLGAAAAWLVEGGRAPRQKFRRKLLVSALQSAIFNELLKARIDSGTIDGVLDGDLLKKEETGGLFVSEDPVTDGPRAASFEVSATGPMFGAKMRWPERAALEAEEEALARWKMSRETLASFRRAGPGTRRPYRVKLGEPSCEPDPLGLRLSFLLPAGAYATIVLRELLRRTVR